MAEISFEIVEAQSVSSAPQDPNTHALVQNPFAWDEQE